MKGQNVKVGRQQWVEEYKRLIYKILSLIKSQQALFYTELTPLKNSVY
jgi:hypothetical protein